MCRKLFKKVLKVLSRNPTEKALECPIWASRGVKYQRILSQTQSTVTLDLNERGPFGVGAFLSLHRGQDCSLLCHWRVGRGGCSYTAKSPNLLAFEVYICCDVINFSWYGPKTLYLILCVWFSVRFINTVLTITYSLLFIDTMFNWLSNLAHHISGIFHALFYQDACKNK